MPYEGPGRYRHYKGGFYKVLGLAIREESKEEERWVTEVVYSPLSSGSFLETTEEEFWTRVRDDFDAMLEGDEVEIGGPELIPRFEKVEEL